MTPKVSVIIPTYNCDRYICQAIDSVLAQTFQDLEIIVMDDGSTDNTRLVLERYGDQIRYIYQENQERSVARNNGIRQSTGEYVAFLDADDVWREDKLARQVKVLDRHPEVSLVYAQAAIIGGDGAWPRGDEIVAIGWGLARPARIYNRLALRNFIPAPTVMVRRQCFDEVGYFDESLVYVEDWDMCLRVAEKYKVAFVPQILAGYRIANQGNMLSRLDGYSVQQGIVRIAEKIPAPSAADSEDLTYLKAKALGRAYIRAACLDYALDHLDDAQRNFSLAVANDPNLLRDPMSAIRVILEEGAYFAYGLGAQMDLLEFVRTVFSNLPEAAHTLAIHQPRAIARAYVALAQRDYAHYRMSLARRHLSTALRLDLSCLKEHLFIRTLLNSLLGSKVIRFLRRMKHRKASRYDHPTGGRQAEPR